MSEARLLAFDLDGTLISCAPRQTTVLLVEANRLDVKVDTSRVWEGKRDGMSTLDALLHVGMSPSKAGQLSRNWRRHIEDPAWLALDSCFDDTLGVLCAARDKGYRLLLVTARTNPTWLRLQLLRLRLASFFDEVRVVSPRSARKEKANLLRRYSPLIYIGDTEVDVDAAACAQVPFFALDRGQRCRSFLARVGASRIGTRLEEALTP
jgi:phosphoglycolate phosphatase-like HAD superfamily hydrolase